MNTDRQNKIFALISWFSFGLFIVIRDKNYILKRSLIENMINIFFELVFFIPIVLLPIKIFEQKVISSIKKDNGLRFTVLICLLSFLYYLLFYLLDFSDRAQHLESLQTIFWIKIPGAISLFIAYVILILLFQFSILLMKKRQSEFFTWKDLLSLSPLAFLPIIFYQVKFIQPQIPLTLILISLFYGGNEKRLGREKFYYHFRFDYRNLPKFLAQSFLAIFVIFVFSLLTGFIELKNFQTKDLVPTVLFKNINVWFYYVGLAEEIIFKIILLRFLADCFANYNYSKPENLGLITSAIIFGLAHALKGWDYAFLAFLSSCVTGTFYLRYRGILSPIFFHMLLDIVAISLFQAKL